MRQIALGIFVTGLITTSAWAQEPTQPRLVTSALLAGMRFDAPALAAQSPPAAAPAPPAKKVTGTFVADFPTSYFFRGYRQESNPKFTFQPGLDVAYAGESATVNLGIWNSFHAGDQEGYYETDLYTAVTAKGIKTTYTAYTYPTLGYPSTINELMFSYSGTSKLAPSVAVAFELQKASGADKGIYLEFGINPAVPMEDAPVALTIPVKVGLGLKDYYFDPTTGDDTAFGYFSAGLNISRPLSHGDIHGNVTIYGFGDALKAVNNDNAAQFTASIGLTLTF